MKCTDTYNSPATNLTLEVQESIRSLSKRLILEDISKAALPGIGLPRGNSEVELKWAEKCYLSSSACLQEFLPVPKTTDKSLQDFKNYVDNSKVQLLKNA